MEPAADTSVIAPARLLSVTPVVRLVTWVTAPPAPVVYPIPAPVAPEDVSPAVTASETPVVAVPSTTFPVAVPFSVIVPVPFALIANDSFVPEDIVVRATPPVTAAPLTETPVATDAVEASTLITGLVAPFAPTVNAEALVEVPVKVPLIARFPEEISVANGLVQPLHYCHLDLFLLQKSSFLPCFYNLFIVNNFFIFEMYWYVS